jgi:hypothetical protein
MVDIKERKANELEQEIKRIDWNVRREQERDTLQVQSNEMGEKVVKRKDDNEGNVRREQERDLLQVPYNEDSGLLEQMQRVSVYFILFWKRTYS